MAAAFRASAVEFLHRHGFSAQHAPSGPRHINDFQRGALRDAAAGHRLEAEFQGIRLDRRHSANFQHDQFHPAGVFAPRRIFNQLQHAFGQGHFMHPGTP